MKKPDKIEVRHLFPDLYSELIEVLQKLSADEWNYPTSSSKWSVKDIVAHLIDTDLRRISFQRDHLTPPTYNKQIDDFKNIVEYLNYLNNTWVDAAKRLSQGVLIDLLNYIKIEMPKLLNSLDMESKALFAVWWAGEDESKCWFDIAREYTEKWYHHQQIRAALGKPLLVEQKWIHPLIDTFVRGLPNIYQKVYPDKNNVSVLLEVEDILEGKWILKKNNSWELFVGEELDYTSKVVMNADTTWRMFTKNISKEAAKKRISIYGDIELGQVILELTTVIK
ncbi:MAG: maleylpyruvate isomerase N-terminal domain-containing protein [Ignavibacteriaceae bacterium]|nr:maleylpyruvate isomerase N-terminal domain-containing protein [Ignavibacteriaceae bacterium]